MDAVWTLAERKQARVQAMRAAIVDLRAALSDYAARRAGRFILYGSAVSQRLHSDSDVDVLVDFPPDDEAAALDFVELTCARLGLRPDAQPLRWCKQAFLTRILPTAESLP